MEAPSRTPLPSYAGVPTYDPSEGDRMAEEDEAEVVGGAASAEPMGCVDYMLLAVASICLLLFILIARRVAVGIFVALVCIGICAYAAVNAQMSTGPTRYLSALLSFLAVCAFLWWSFRFVFYIPKAKSSTGCGGVFFSNLDNDLSKPRPHDEL